MLTIALAGGPMKTIPSLASLSEKTAFSLRNPYLQYFRYWLVQRFQPEYAFSTQDVPPKKDTLSSANPGINCMTYLCTTAMANFYDFIHAKLR